MNTPLPPVSATTLPPLNLTTSALEAPREYSEYYGDFESCERVRWTAREIGYRVPPCPILFFPELQRWGVLVECSEETLCDIVEYAMAERKAA